MIFLRRIGVERQLRRLTCRFSRKLGHLEQRLLVTCWADVAQLVEQPIRNRQVSGSSPLVGSSFQALNTAFAEPSNRWQLCCHELRKILPSSEQCWKRQVTSRLPALPESAVARSDADRR